MKVEQNVLDRAKEWLTAGYDEETRAAVQQMMDNNPEELTECFYKDLEFGTGGMRGIMGVGTNRLNKYTIGAATQGFANYILEAFPGKESAVAIAYDVRHNSDTFGQLVANILSANGIKAYLFENHRATPELSFAVRHLGCQGGVILTASHNPPEYNGYKVYWDDGSQVVPPHDENIIHEVQNVRAEDIKFEANNDLIEYIGKEVDDAFVAAAVKYSSFDASGRDDFSMVYTPIHGTSYTTMIPALEAAGFKNVHTVAEQMKPSGDFPTVKSPNPEEPEALAMATELANKTGADLLVGTDPDGDRLGIAVRNLDGEMQLLNGNQCNTVLIDYLLRQWKAAGKLDGNQFIGSTIVTSDIFIELAKNYGIECKAGLTGFKWIAQFVREEEGKKQFIGGGEESFGFMVSDFVRDKDSITSTLLACEVAAVAKAQGSSFFKELVRIYTETGFFKENLISIVRKGMSGAEEIKQMMIDLREQPLQEIDGSKVVRIDDYQSSISKDMVNGAECTIALPKSNVLIYYTEDGTKIAARPSGTEPKIKFYFSVRTAFNDPSRFKETEAGLDAKIKRIIEEMKLQ